MLNFRIFFSNFAPPFDNSTTRITIANETLALTELISMPPFNEETVKKPHLCPNCGKILSGLTSYRRHLVSKLNPRYFSFFWTNLAKHIILSSVIKLFLENDRMIFYCSKLFSRPSQQIVRKLQFLSKYIQC